MVMNWGSIRSLSRAATVRQGPSRAVKGRSLMNGWRSILFRLRAYTYDASPRGVRMDELTESRRLPTLAFDVIVLLLVVTSRARCVLLTASAGTAGWPARLGTVGSNRHGRVHMGTGAQAADQAGVLAGLRGRAERHPGAHRGAHRETHREQRRNREGEKTQREREREGERTEIERVRERQSARAPER